MSGGAERRRAAAVSTVAVAAATVLVLLVALWAASSGPDDPFRGDGPAPDRFSTSDPPTPSETPAPVTTEPETSDDGEAGWFTTALAVLLGLIALVFAVTVLSLLVAAWSGRPRLGRRRTREEAPLVPDVDPVETVSVALAADADDQEQLLAAGTPRNGIVGCWHRFEEQAERAGVPRAGWETSAEFTLRLLALVEADVDAVARLSALYREARFSEHDLDEDDRAEALAALRRIHLDLRSLLSQDRA